MTKASVLKASVSQDLPNLDILRAFAVLLVVLGHFLMYAGLGRWCGWMGLTGVCLFFIHTCLVLMWSLERDPHTGRFYIRRAFRLFPLWLVVLCVIVLTHFPSAPDAAPGWQYHSPSILEFLANATLTANLWYGTHIVGASWSLPVEAQMYLLLPLLFFFIRSTSAFWVVLLVDALAIASAYVYAETTTSATLGICIPYFLPGVLAYMLYNRIKPRLPGWTFLVFLLAAAAVHHRHGTLAHSMFFCLGVGLALPFFRQIQWKPLTKTAHLIARYSYGIYLCHIPSICVGLHFLHGYNIAIRLAAIPICIIIFSVVLYHAVEKPMIRYGAKLAKRIEPGPGPVINETALNLEPAP